MFISSNQPALPKGAICTVDFGQHPGHTVTKQRPALVLSATHLNSMVQTVLVSPITSNPKYAAFPTAVRLAPDETTGLTMVSYVNLLQIYAVDKVIIKEVLGIISGTKLDEVAKAIKEVMDI